MSLMLWHKNQIWQAENQLLHESIWYANNKANNLYFQHSQTNHSAEGQIGFMITLMNSYSTHQWFRAEEPEIGGIGRWHYKKSLSGGK